MLDKDRREALGRIQREAISKKVGLAILKQHLPELAAFNGEMFTKIIQIANDIEGEKPWPFKALCRAGGN
jgi:hypothetical protein